MSERLPGYERMHTILLCKQHNSVLVKDAMGHYYCYEGGERLKSRDDVYEGIGKAVSFEDLCEE